VTAPPSKAAPTTVSDAAFAEASLWHARLREPDVGMETLEAFQDWLASDPSHLDAYDQAERLWAAMGSEQAGVPRDETAIQALVESVRPRRRLARGVITGLLLCVAVAGADWVRRGGIDDLRADYIAPVGTQRMVQLADGSAVELNTDTAVAVDLAPARRSVRLFRGEAFFQVEHDPQRPFFVETGDGEVRVTGTSFNVRVRNGITEVGLVKGGVRLTAADRPDSMLNLVPGQEGEMTAQGLSAPRSFDADKITAWRRGQVVFFRTPLGDVIDELNRYQRGRILVLGEKLRTLPVTGVFDTRDPAAVIDIIETTLGVSSIRFTDALIVLR
jgi:transmembrane sensor